MDHVFVVLPAVMKRIKLVMSGLERFILLVIPTVVIFTALVVFTILVVLLFSSGSTFPFNPSTQQPKVSSAFLDTLLNFVYGSLLVKDVTLDGLYGHFLRCLTSSPREEIPMSLMMFTVEILCHRSNLWGPRSFLGRSELQSLA